MRVLCINRYFSFAGGVERYLIDLCSQFQKDNMEVDILFCEGKKNVPYKKAYIIPEFWDRRKKLTCEMISELQSVIGDSRPDVIFLNNMDNGGIVSLLASTIPTVRYIHGHANTCPDGKRLLSNPTEDCRYPLSLMCAIRAHSRFCMPRSPRKAWYCYHGAKKNLFASVLLPKTIVASSYMKNMLVLNGVPRDKVEILPYFTTWPKETWLEPGDFNRILFVGRISEGKGLLELIESMVGVLAEVHLDVVGDGPLRLQAEEKCRKLGLENRVAFYGVLEGESLKDRYRHNAVLVVPSLWPEPFGIIGLEAAMCCRPTVAFDVGGISEWLKNGETGYLIPSGNFSAMWEKIEELLKSKEKIRKFGTQAADFVAQNFSMTKHVTRLKEIFQEVIDMKIRERQL